MNGVPPGDDGAARRFPLLEDGALELSAPRELARAVGEWLPRLPAVIAPAPASARIHVERGVPAAPPRAAPSMALGCVRGWGPADGQVRLAGESGRVDARVDLDTRTAVVRLDPRGEGPGGHEVSCTFTLAAGLLLNRLGRALVHAAAVVAPGGGAWLLPGDHFSGKSTTCLTLIRGGWNYLSDDHVVLWASGDGIRAAGWARPFQLDVGYADGASRGVRSPVRPDDFGPGGWRQAAPLAGLLFPRVEAGLPTELRRAEPGAALAALLRQSPIVSTDRLAARPVLELLGRVARLPAYELRLGRDTYCYAERLQTVLMPAISSVIAEKILVSET